MKIDDASLNNLILKVTFKNGSWHMIADHSNFIDLYEAPSAYYQLFPGEKCPLHPGDIIKMGNLKFAVERFTT
jgi:hypothetical protein